MKPALFSHNRAAQSNTENETEFDFPLRGLNRRVREKKPSLASQPNKKTHESKDHGEPN